MGHQEIILDTAGVAELICRKGDTFGPLVLYFEDSNGVQDLAGSTFKLTVKKTPNQPTVLLIQVNDLPVEPYFNIDNVEIPAGKWVSFNASASSMNMPAGDYQYDIQQNNGDIIQTRLTGIFKVRQDVS